MRTNLQIIRELINPNTDKYGLIPNLIEPLKEQIYPRLEEFETKLKIVLCAQKFSTINDVDSFTSEEYFKILKESVQQSKITLEDSKIFEELVKDIEYISSMKDKEKLFNNDPNQPFLSDVVPVSGLALNYFHRMEMELKTVLEIWETSDQPRGRSKLMRTTSRAMIAKSLNEQNTKPKVTRANTVSAEPKTHLKDVVSRLPKAPIPVHAPTVTTSGGSPTLPSVVPLVIKRPNGKIANGVRLSEVPVEQLAQLSNEEVKKLFQKSIKIAPLFPSMAQKHSKVPTAFYSAPLPITDPGSSLLNDSETTSNSELNSSSPSNIEQNYSRPIVMNPLSPFQPQDDSESDIIPLSYVTELRQQPSYQVLRHIAFSESEDQYNKSNNAIQSSSLLSSYDRNEDDDSDKYEQPIYNLDLGPGDNQTSNEIASV